MVMKKENILHYHCCVDSEDTEVPELVAEHLVLILPDDHRHFLEARTKGEFFDCDREFPEYFCST